MYAMMREAFYLVENGYATVEDVDRSVRNDMGYWITMAGPFRYMGLTGIPAVDEQLELARRTGCTLQISHLQAVGPRN